MKIAGRYSFNGGEKYIEKKYKTSLKEIEQIIFSVDADKYKTKTSKEKTMPGKKLFSPISLNKAFKDKFISLNWQHIRVKCEYPVEYYTENYKSNSLTKGAFREMDFIKSHLGVEIQFGKYAFMVYNVCAKMTIFHNLGFIDSGVEIVPIHQFASEMSTGVSYFEQFVWDLQHRGISNIDIPVIIFGIDV